MLPRQRVLAAIAHDPPDRLPLFEHFWDGTERQWREQGLPADMRLADWFEFDVEPVYLDVSPRFDGRIVQQDGDFMIWQDRFGYTARRYVGRSSSLEFVSHLTTDRQAWEQHRHRFELIDDGEARIDTASYFCHLDPYPTWREAADRIEPLRKTGRYLLAHAYGPFSATWRHHGFEETLLDVVESPDWIMDMAMTYARLLVAVVRRCVDEGMRPDGCLLMEDLGSTASLLMSPDSYRATLKPALAHAGAGLRELGVQLWLHSDGAVEPLIEDFLDCGVVVLNPLQHSAGLDIATLKARFGKRLAYCGNLPSTSLEKDDPPMQPFAERLAQLARAGGVIFHSDHSVPEGVTFQRYAQAVGIARKAFDRRMA